MVVRLQSLDSLNSISEQKHKKLKKARCKEVLQFKVRRKGNSKEEANALYGMEIVV